MAGTQSHKRKMEYIAMAILLALLPGCGSPHEASLNDYFSDPQVVALARASQSGDVAAIDRLVAEGVNVNAKGKYGLTPLFFALAARNREGFQRLLKHKGDPNIQSETGESAISLAAKVEDDSYFLESALKHGGNPNLVDHIDFVVKDQTPIYNAILRETSKTFNCWLRQEQI